MKKRVLTYIMTLCMICALCACGTKDVPTSTTTAVQDEVAYVAAGTYKVKEDIPVYQEKDTASPQIDLLETNDIIHVTEDAKDGWTAMTIGDQTGYYQADAAKLIQVDENKLTTVDYMAASATAKKATQIITVVGPYKKEGGKKLYHVVLWQKAGSRWYEKLKTDRGLCGTNGLSANRTRGDKTTPIGSYELLYAFGQVGDPGAKMEYKKITPYSYWASSSNSWEESKKHIEGEHLADYETAYKYAMPLRFNMDPYVRKSGSAIFLHCHSGHNSTAGCISVEESVMRTFVKTINYGAYIMIVSKDKDLMKY